MAILPSWFPERDNLAMTWLAVMTVIRLESGRCFIILAIACATLSFGRHQGEAASDPPEVLPADLAHDNLEVVPLVSLFGDPDRFEFVGLATFRREEVLLALEADPHFIMASFPFAPLDAFLVTVEERLRTGYQSLGFPAVSVEATLQEDRHRVLIQVEEGPRYVAGPVRVRGARTVPEEALVKRLTEAWSIARVLEAGDPPNQPPGETASSRALSEQAAQAYLDSTGKSAKPTPPIWRRGDPAPFHPQFKGLALERVRTILGEFGYFNPTVMVAVLPGSDNREAVLEVVIEEEGVHGLIGEISLTGHERNSREAILEYLGLQVGMTVPHDLLARLEHRLWYSGRFLKYEVVPEFMVGETNRIRLAIRLEELPEAPPLTEPFSETEQVLLKLRDWLSTALEQGEDLVGYVEGRIPDSPLIKRLEICLSRQGAVLILRNGAAQGTEEFEAGLIFSAAGLELLAPRSRRRLALGMEEQQFTLQAQILPSVDGDDTNRFTFQFGAGFSSVGEAETKGTMGLDLLLAPAAFVDLAHREFRPERSGDLLTLAREGFQVVLNLQSGRLEQARGEDEKIEGRFEYRFDRGSFEAMAARYRELTAGYENVAPAGRPLTGLARFAAWELLQWEGWMEPAWDDAMRARRREAARAVDDILTRGFLQPVDQLVQSLSSADQEAFSIPLKLPPQLASVVDLWFSMAGTALVRLGHDLFPAQSWPQSLARLLALTSLDAKEYKSQELLTLYESPAVGPIGFLATAKLLSLTRGSAALLFVNRGLERLALEEFRKDAQLLYQEGTLLNQMAGKMVGVLRDVEPVELETLARAMPEETGRLFRLAVRLAQEQSDALIREVLPPLLDEWWQGGLQQQVAEAFYQMKGQSLALAKAQEAFEQAARLLEKESDLPSAVAALRQAAQLGHAQAQYQLGKCCEEGIGLDQDFSQALAWYRQAAENGWLEAQMTLGNIYSDGFSIAPDPAQAATWFSLAALQGHRAAGLLARSALRKLAPAQIQEVSTRLEQILNRPFKDLKAELEGDKGPASPSPQGGSP